MNRPAAPTLTPAHAAALIDLSLAGVWHDFGEAELLQEPTPQPVPTPSLIAANLPRSLVVNAAPEAPRPPAPTASKAWVIAAEATPLTDTGLPSVVLVVGGNGEHGLPLGAAATALIGRMLAAAGLAARPINWLVLARGEGEQTTLFNTLEPLIAAPHTPAQIPVLVLGKDMLSALLSTPTSVEQWGGQPPHNLPQKIAANAALGATFAPDYLLAQPISKKRAWGHVQSWMAKFGQQKNL